MFAGEQRKLLAGVMVWNLAKICLPIEQTTNRAASVNFAAVKSLEKTLDCFFIN